MRPAAAVVLAGLATTLLAGSVQASEADDDVMPRFLVLPGLTVRNGDWLSIDGLGLLRLALLGPNNALAASVRGELGIGGAAAGVGLTAGGFPGPCFNGAGLFALEARAERTFGPTTWRSTTYVGPQLSYSLALIKLSLGWMVGVQDASDNHVQLGLGVGW